MTERHIPFKPMFGELMLTDKKTMTSRPRKMADVSDTFKAFGTEFTITKVYPYSLDCVAWLHHREEGFESFEKFVECWRQIHPERGYDPLWQVWVHEFKRSDLKT